MQTPTEFNEQAADPTVQRPAQAAKFSEEHEAALVRLIEKPWRTQARTNAEIMKTEQEALAPLLAMLADSADAVAASRALSRLKLQVWSEKVHLARSGLVRPYGGDFQANFRPIGAGVNVFGPPYDFEVRQPTSGEGVTVKPNRHDGSLSVALNMGVGGARFATAGVGMVLQASVPGVAHITPYWPFEYFWSIEGHLFSGHTEGACRVVVQDAFNAGVLDPTGQRSVQFWKHTSQTSAGGETDGVVYSQDIETTVALSAGQVFNVSLLATAMVDDSEGSVFGWSMAGAELKMRLPFFAVRMNVP